MPDKCHDLDSKVKYEMVSYNPLLKDTADLEAATKVITRTTEASGLGSADYSNVQTMANPPDPRMSILRLASRLLIHIDSFSGATHLYCRVYVDAQDTAHRLFDVDMTSAAADNISIVDLYSTNLAAIFALLCDGAAHTFYFFFWVNQATSATISVVELWYGIGISGTTINTPCLNFNFSGQIMPTCAFSRIGSGTVAAGWIPVSDNGFYYTHPSAYVFSNPLLTNGYFRLRLSNSGGTTDISYMSSLYLVCRGES